MFNRLKINVPRLADPAEKIKYLVCGEDGLYVFDAHWANVAHDMKEWKALGFEILGVDGIDGCDLGGVKC